MHPQIAVQKKTNMMETSSRGYVMIPNGRRYVYAYTKITCKIDGADEDVAQTGNGPTDTVTGCCINV